MYPPFCLDCKYCMPAVIICQPLFMKIAIDINELTLKQKTGVKVYTREIVKALEQIDKENEYLLYMNCRDGDLSRLDSKIVMDPDAINPDVVNPDAINRDAINRRLYGYNFKIKPSKSRLPFWTYTKLPQEIKKDRPDVLFMPIQAVPFFKKPKNLKIVVTIHDLAFLLFPNHFTRKDKFLLNFHTKRAIKMADKIVAPSEATKRDIVKFYGTSPNSLLLGGEDKIKVVWHGVTLPSSPLSVRERTLPLLGGVGGGKIDKPYILFVGSIQPRKNITGLIKAFELLNTKYKIQNTELVICGGKGWMADEIYKRAKESKFSKDIIFTGSVSDEERDEFYKNALIFALPSFYEGFGLPVLEAMSFGVPCVVGNNSSFPEIANDNALFVDANNSDDIAEKINLLISNGELRNNLSQKGIKNAENFSWIEAAKKTLEIFKS